MNPISRILHLTLAVTGVMLLWGAPLSANTVNDTLGSDLPPAVKESVRAMIAAGIDSRDAVNITNGLAAGGFSVGEIRTAHQMILELHRSDLPITPLINKAREGIAKRVSPTRILRAMQAVKSRHEFSFHHVLTLTDRVENAGRLADILASGLAAGISETDAVRIVDALRGNSRQMNADQLDDLSAAVLVTARDMARLGISSETSADLMTSALAKGRSANDVRSMRAAFLDPSRTQPPEDLARGFAKAIAHGQPLPGAEGVAGGLSGDQSDGGGHGPGSDPGGHR